MSYFSYQNLPQLELFELKGYMSRQTTYMKDWFFQCICQRCSDESEFGTFTSSIKCVDCSKKPSKRYMAKNFIFEYVHIENITNVLKNINNNK